MKRKTIVILLMIWFAIFLVDVICALTISQPIFMLWVTGGERTDFYGLGYKMTHWYAMMPDGYWDGGFEINPIGYLIINGFILVRLLKDKKLTNGVK